MSLDAGNTHLNFPDASFEGKTGFSYGAGLSAQLNFGSHRRSGIKAEAIYARTSALYPDETDIYSAALKYKGSELFVPVQFIIQGGGSGTAYLGLGGYYDYKFKTSLPVGQTIRKDGYGFSAEFGLKVAGVGLSVIWMSSLTPFFENESAPSVRQGTALFRISKYF